MIECFKRFPRNNDVVIVGMNHATRLLWLFL